MVPRKEKGRDGRNIVEEIPRFLAQHSNPHHHQHQIRQMSGNLNVQT